MAALASPAVKDHSEKVVLVCQAVRAPGAVGRKVEVVDGETNRPVQLHYQSLFEREAFEMNNEDVRRFGDA